MSAKLKSALLLLVAVVVTASGVAVVRTQKASAAACTPPSTDYGTVTQTVSIPSDGTYRIWSRIMAPDSTANSYLLEIDGNTCFTVGDSAITANTWTWIDYQNGSTTSKINATLTAGNHTVKFIGREDGVDLDRVVFTADTACVPTGDGDNCASPPDTTPPSTVNITTPANGTTQSGSFSVNVTAIDDSAISQVELLVDGTSVSTDTTGTSNVYNFTVNAAPLSAGSHTLQARATDTSGNIASSSTISFTRPDTTAPSISSITAGSITQTTATITWTTNEASDTQVEYGTTTSYGTSTTLNTSMVTSHSAGLSSLTAGTLYHYRVKSRDAAGNLATSADGTFTTTAAPVADTTKPTVSLTAPTNNSTQSGTVTVSANASDNVGVVGVQFKVDGANLGAEDTSSPYSVSWNTSTFSNGTHSITALARDAAGNTQTSTAFTITVNNVTYSAEDIDMNGIVDLRDFSRLASKYGMTVTAGTREDIDGNGVVDLRDFSRLAARYGQS